ncbi:lysozyme inhibitor LprI family protein [Stenotrophomonas panacihumi]|uniref:lysozyme inhibitor LprI family protein n=1 Tax=Stenotrophomonas panacihumi TaxID=676599 RepID=UPI0009D70DFC|nr:DUF1311 domain-containing protein [Stenotrophomonas panacihumi]
MIRWLLLLFLIASWPTCASEAWDFAKPHKERCATGGQQDMNLCIYREYKQVESRVDHAYEGLLSSLEDPIPLQRAQLAWVAFRDASCLYEASGFGEEGSFYPFVTYSCRIDLAEKRLRDLEAYAECTGNGCPVRKI